MSSYEYMSYAQVRRSILLPDSYLKDCICQIIMDNRHLRKKVKMLEKEVGTIGKHLDGMSLRKKVGWNKVEIRVFVWSPDFLSETNCMEVTEEDEKE